MGTRMSDLEVREARRIIAVQASTLPADGNIGPTGAWGRASGVSDGAGRNAHERMGDAVFRSTHDDRQGQQLRETA